MGVSKMQRWIIGTAVLSVLVIVATWFLVVTPRLAEAAETRSATEDALARQDQLRVQLAQLEADFARIDEYRTDLAALRVQIPADDQLSDIVRQIDTIALQNGVALLSMVTEPPESFRETLSPTSTAPPAPTTDAATGDPATGDATTDPAAGDTGATDTGAAADPAVTDPAATDPATGQTTGTDPAAGAASVPPAVESLVAIPVTFTVQGSYAGAAGFLNALQEGISRVFLVGGFTWVSMVEAPAAGGRPAANLGDVEMTITGLFYAYPEDTTALPDPDDTEGDTEEEPSAPPTLPYSDRNPFSPVTG